MILLQMLWRLCHYVTILEWIYYNKESIKDKHGNHEKAGGEWKIQCVDHFAVDLLSISQLTVIPVIMKFIVNAA